MIEAHALPVLARLSAVITSPRKVFVGKVDPPVTNLAATPYVLARFAEAAPALAFTGVTHLYAMRIACHCVGASEMAAMQMADLAAAALQDFTPTVPGRTCFPLRWDDATGQSPNEATGTSVHNQIRVYLLRSVPA